MNLVNTEEIEDAKLSEILGSFKLELESLIDEEDEDQDDWGTYTMDYLVASAQAQVEFLKGALSGTDKDLIRTHALELGLAALKIAYTHGGL